MNDSKAISFEEAVRVLDVCVAERGADYVYPETAKRMGVCEYWWVEGEFSFDCDDSSLPEGPGCIVGLALSKLGVSDEFLKGLGGVNAEIVLAQLVDVGWRVDPDAAKLFRYAQIKQDSEWSWAYAVEQAKLYFHSGEDL